MARGRSQRSSTSTFSSGIPRTSIATQSNTSSGSRAISTRPENLRSATLTAHDGGHPTAAARPPRDPGRGPDPPGAGSTPGILRPPRPGSHPLGAVAAPPGAAHLAPLRPPGPDRPGVALADRRRPAGPAPRGLDRGRLAGGGAGLHRARLPSSPAPPPLRPGPAPRPRPPDPARPARPAGEDATARAAGGARPPPARRRPRPRPLRRPDPAAAAPPAPGLRRPGPPLPPRLLGRGRTHPSRLA